MDLPPNDNLGEYIDVIPPGDSSAAADDYLEILSASKEENVNPCTPPAETETPNTKNLDDILEEFSKNKNKNKNLKNIFENIKKFKSSINEFILFIESNKSNIINYIINNEINGIKVRQLQKNRINKIFEYIDTETYVDKPTPVKYFKYFSDLDTYLLAEEYNGLTPGLYIPIAMECNISIDNENVKFKYRLKGKPISLFLKGETIPCGDILLKDVNSTNIFSGDMFIGSKEYYDRINDVINKTYTIVEFNSKISSYNVTPQKIILKKINIESIIKKYRLNEKKKMPIENWVKEFMERIIEKTYHESDEAIYEEEKQYRGAYNARGGMGQLLGEYDGLDSYNTSCIKEEFMEDNNNKNLDYDDESVAEKEKRKYIQLKFNETFIEKYRCRFYELYDFYEGVFEMSLENPEIVNSYKWFQMTNRTQEVEKNRKKIMRGGVNINGGQYPKRITRKRKNRYTRKRKNIRKNKKATRRRRR